jgi:hypothetical protein
MFAVQLSTRSNRCLCRELRRLCRVKQNAESRCPLLVISVYIFLSFFTSVFGCWWVSSIENNLSSTNVACSHPLKKPFRLVRLACFLLGGLSNRILQINQRPLQEWSKAWVLRLVSPRDLAQENERKLSSARHVKKGRGNRNKIQVPDPTRHQRKNKQVTPL